MGQAYFWIILREAKENIRDLTLEIFLTANIASMCVLASIPAPIIHNSILSTSLRDNSDCDPRIFELIFLPC